MKRNLFFSILSINLVLSTFIYLLSFQILPVFAAEQTTPEYTCTIPLTRTDWLTPTNASPCSLTKFDPSLGTLTKVLLRVDGMIRSEIGLENRDTAIQQITAHVQATVTLKRPDNSGNIAIILPEVSASDTFAPYDNLNDYDGVSGNTYLNIDSTRSQNFEFTDNSDLAIFTSSMPNTLENVVLPASATGDSDYSASANYSGYVDTFAGLTATVSYVYQAQDLSITVHDIPQPSTGFESLLPIDVNNLENESTQGLVTVIVNLPNGVSYNSGNGSNWTEVTYNNNQLTLILNSPIPANSNTRIEIPVTLSNGINGETITGSVAGVQTDQNLTDNIDSTIINITNVTPQSQGLPPVLGVVTATPQSGSQSQPSSEQTANNRPRGSVLGVSERVTLRTGGQSIFQPSTVYLISFLLLAVVNIWISYSKNLS